LAVLGEERHPQKELKWVAIISPEEYVSLGDVSKLQVVVSRQSYSVCRDKDIYPEPLVFRPERYLNEMYLLI
jgi:hypothetical protein